MSTTTEPEVTVARDGWGASAKAIEHHYDVGNDFFGLWLDPSMTYSCPLWEGPEDTLEAAQERKLDYLIASTNAAGKRRVLDVGCGWGSLLRRLTQEHGVEQAVGLTLSPSQAAYGTERAGGDSRIDTRVENWQDHQPEEGYDAIISIGAFEHFASMGMPRAERIAGYREFFQRCFDWLPSGGRVAVQTIVKGSNGKLDRKTVRDMLFICDRIYPESQIPWVSEMLEASEKQFDVVTARLDPDHYVRTLHDWHGRLQDRRQEAVDMVGPEVVADYERYLIAFAEHFANRHTNLARIVFERV
ncbi:MAG: cyclopropane-fatty-acyl-phospholipid synthase family protein [Actinomycetota bacterium]|nr:cyclopropane-fatty-acyl-phospholipid synthase family protein [Actinomycetota bacterium]